MEHRCPVCHKKVKLIPGETSEETEYFPFCSRRCKLIDLGAWMDEEYKIPSPLEHKDDNEESSPAELPE